MICVFQSDLHLEAYVPNCRLVDLAIEEEVASVLLVGDLYDGDWKDYNTGLYFVERMGRLREAGIRVFIVAGNHDAASQITKHLRLPDNVTLFSTKKPERVVMDDLGVSICGQGFAKMVCPGSALN